MRAAAWPLLLVAGCSLAVEENISPPADAGVAVDAGQAVDPCAPNPCIAQRRTVCAVEDGGAVCRCDEGHQLVGEHCLPVAPCEDGDCIGSPLALSRGEAVEGSLNRDGGDPEDWYLLGPPSAGGVETFVLELIGDSGPEAQRGEGEAPPLLPNMALFVAPDLDGPARQLPRDDAPEDGRFHRVLSARVPAGAVLLLRLSDADPAPISYRITAQPTLSDDFPGVSEDAPTVAIGAQAFRLETREDVDVMVFEIAEAGALVVGVTIDQPARSPSDLSLRLATEGQSDARRYYGRARHPVVPGRIVLRIDHPQGHLVSGTIHTTLLEGDDHGDRAEAATPTEADSGAVLLGHLDEGDEDWFAFPARRGLVYRVLYEGDGQLDGRRADGDAMTWSHADGEHYRHDGEDSDVVLRVSGAPHDYRIMIFGTELDDPEGNSASAALVPGLVDQLEGNLAYPGDVDYIGPFFGPDTLCASVSPVLAMSLVDGEGQTVAEGGETGRLERQLEAGMYTLRLAAANPGQAATPTAYSLDLRCP